MNARMLGIYLSSISDGAASNSAEHRPERQKEKMARGGEGPLSISTDKGPGCGYLTKAVDPAGLEICLFTLHLNVESNVKVTRVLVVPIHLDMSLFGLKTSRI